MKSNFKIMALGGLDENGKNCYLIETEKEILVIDAGSANFDQKALGVSTVIPDFGYLETTKKKVVGILVSHGHFDQMGGLTNLLETLKVPVYGSVYTIEFLKHYVKKNDFNLLKPIKYNEQLKLGIFMIDVFSLSHAIYGNYGFVIKAGEESIVYATDYNFDQVESKIARSDLKKMVALSTKHNILTLLTESVSAEHAGAAASNQNFIKRFDRFIESAKGRIFISLYSSNLAGMRNIIKMAQDYDRKIVIIGRDLLNYVNIARSLGFIEHKRELFVRIPDMKKYEDDQLIIVVSGLYAEPMQELGKMSMNMHNILSIKEEDSILLAAKPTDETEGEAQKILDKIARTHCFIDQFNINVPSHAYSEDIKMLINIFEPKFVVPIKGEYRKLKLVQELAQTIGYEPENVVLASNGDVIEVFKDSILTSDHIKIGTNYMSSDRAREINPILLRDREILSDAGYVMVVMTFEKKSDKLIQNPEIISGGLGQFDDKYLVEGIQKIVIKQIEAGTSSKELVNKVRNKVGRFLQNKIGSQPMVLPIRIEIDPKRIKG